jgi:hypothetical protein
MKTKITQNQWIRIGKTAGWLPKTASLDSDKPPDYSDDNGHGKPTHLKLKNGSWIRTPKDYQLRSDGIMSHKYLRDEDGIPTWFLVPSHEELEKWVYDGTCETPWGEIVEPDHPKGWLRILGLI